MNNRAYPPRRGLALTLIPILILVLLTGPVWARMDVNTAIDGDPGDGNLGPCEYSSSSGSTPSGGDILSKDGVVTTTESTRVFFWVLPLPGVYPGSSLQPFWLSRSVLDQFRADLRWERGSGHVR